MLCREHRGDEVLQARRPSLQWRQCRETSLEAQPRPADLFRGAWGARAGYRGHGQIRLLPSVSQEPPPGPRPPPSLPHCGGPTHRDRAPGERKRALPSGPIGASISRGLIAAGFRAWVSEMDRGRAPPACHGHCFWCVHIPCPLGPKGS